MQPGKEREIWVSPYHRNTLERINFLKTLIFKLNMILWQYTKSLQRAELLLNFKTRQSQLQRLILFSDKD